MARKPTGSLVWQKKADGRKWAYVRVTLPDGTRGPLIPLETTDPRVARLHQPRAVKAARAAVSDEEVRSEATRAETFSEAVDRIMAHLEREGGHKGTGLHDPKGKRSRLERWAYPIMADLHVDQIRPGHIREALEKCRDDGKADETIKHLKWDLSSIFRYLEEEEIIEANPVRKVVGSPKGKKDTRERAVLRDEELAVYLKWTHPEKRHQVAVLERQTMACVSRMFGGVRTSDILVAEWEDFETEDGRFSYGWAERKKTNQPQLLEVPELLRPILRRWWERAGKPSSGYVFPKLRGDGAGEDPRVKSTFAKALRSDLTRALGLEVYRAVEVEDSRCSKIVWKWVDTDERGQPIAWTPRQTALLKGDKRTKPVDFHSFRRAYSQALGNAGVNAQTAMALAGHSTTEAHGRYLRNAQQMRQVPPSALPKLDVDESSKGRAVKSPKGGKNPEETRESDPESSNVKTDDDSANDDSPDTAKSPVETGDWAGSSVVERWPYKPDVAGSRPVPPTIRAQSCAPSPRCRIPGGWHEWRQRKGAGRWRGGWCMRQRGIMN